MSDQGKSSTRVSQQPDWIISGLLKAAAFPEQKPTEPMFSTGVSYAQLKEQVKSLLVRSGLNLTKSELSTGTYWLTERIAKQVSDQDTIETLTQKMNDFVAQYIVDKSVQRASGTHERSPIYDRKWYDEHFTPPTDREASDAAKDEKPENGAQVIDMVYVGLDGDSMGHLVEDSLLTDSPETAARISDSIHEAHRAIRKMVKDSGGKLIFDGGDNMLFYAPNDPELLESMRAVHKKITKHTITIGVGRRPVEAHYALVVGKNTGKDKVVAYDDSVKAEYEAIHKEQEDLAPTLQKLKYRAEAEDMNVADRLSNVLRSLGMESGPTAARSLFWRLVQSWSLDDLRSIEQFFSSASDEDLASAARQTRAQRLGWDLRYSEARDMSKAEGQTLVHGLTRVVESVSGLHQKIKDLVAKVNDQALRDIDDGMERAWSRAEGVISEFAKIIIDGDTPRHSHYADSIPSLAAQITSMAIPIDQELNKALKALTNAEGAGNPQIDASPLIDILWRWINMVNVLAMNVDMVCVVSGVKPQVLVAAAPTHFPGQTNMPHADVGAPPRRFDWLTMEEHNKDKVDWRKTDDQAGLALPGEFAEKSVGGDAGGSPIYVP